MPERDQILRIESERGLEDRARLIVTSSLEQRLTVNDVPAHVAGLLWQKLLTDEDRLVEVAELPVFIRQWREIPPRILVEFLPEFVDAGRTGHCAPAEGSTIGWE